jgi:Dolichyl-phosphate-mannose-protein mannosyltransferase
LNLKNSSLRSRRLCGSIRTVVTFENSFHHLKFRFEITLLLFIFATTAILQWPYLFDFPGYIHGWAQVDRYALSMGFLRNGFDLLHPETMVYNPIYPNDLLVQGATTLTAVDFPIHDYLVALVMKLTGIQSPWLFRVYVIVAGCVGLFYLGKLARLILQDELKAFFVVAFAALSPVFVYYQGSLLPSVPSLALTIAGVYCYFLFRAKESNRFFHVSMVLLALALLSRTTFVIPFVAVLGMEFLSVVKTRMIAWKRYVLVLPIIGLFFLYRWHNDVLRNEYGSMFLHRLIPAESREEVWFLLNYIWEHWRFAYFSSIHYWALALIAFTVLLLFVARKIQKQSRSSLLAFTGIYLLGCLLFAVAMLKQFQDHDYYFLDTFYLPFVLLLVGLLSFLPNAQHRLQKAIYLMVLGSFIAFAFRMPQRSQRNRHEAGVNNRLQNTIENFTGSAEYLDSLGVSRSAIVLVIDAVAPNVPLTLMERKGLVVLFSPKGMIEHAFNWNFDYIVFQNEYFMDFVYRGYPEILQKIRKIGSNGRITVCVRDEGNSQSLDAFLGWTGSIFMEEFMDFEAGNTLKWKGYQTTGTTSHSGLQAACFTKDNSSGLTMEWDDLNESETHYHPAKLSMWIRSDEAIHTNMICRMTADEKEVYYEIRSLKDVAVPSTEWQLVEFSLVLPPFDAQDNRLSIYMDNAEPSTLFYDDVQLRIFR